MSSIDRLGRVINLAIIGLGERGIAQLSTILDMKDVNVSHICDIYEDRIDRACELIKAKSLPSPRCSTNWQEILEDKNVEAVLIMTGWQNHISLAIEFMNCKKIVGLEVGGANSVEECWQLVYASEKNNTPCMMLENCCYGKEEMTVLNMIRKGVFGDIVHCRGGYLHDLREEIGLGDINRHYRQKHFVSRNGELYPTHELGPIAKYLNLNRGNRMTSLVSMSSKSLGQHVWFKENAPNHPLANTTFNQGDIVTTMIKCANGETILLTHDCTLPRAYSRGGLVQGTKGIWMEENRSLYIENISPHDPNDWAHRWENDEKYMEKFCHPLWTEYEKIGRRGGHGGMDYLVLRAFIESIQKNKPFPIDIYDTASWMAITPLSESSISMGSMPVAVPDFTNGLWLKKRPFHQGLYALDE